MAQALRQINDGQQLALYGGSSNGHARTVLRVGTHHPRRAGSTGPASRKLCAGCRAREARYGFRDEAHPQADRPQTLCFDCFRMEIVRRQAVAAQLARGWNASQVRLPLEETLKDLSLRRRRAQIAARHALERS
jgi:hypothetical protein